MRITVRVLAQPDAVRLLERDPMLRSACDLGAVAFSLPADSEAFARVVRLTRDASGLWLTPGMEFTASELAECSFV